jgi:uncharacterized protein YndB with AHSA1/START domain
VNPDLDLGLARIIRAIDELEQIVFTNAIDHTWRPADPAPVVMTAPITLHDHPDGTEYRVLVRHGDPDARARHDRLGFTDGRGTVAGQLAALAESMARR